MRTMSVNLVLTEPEADALRRSALSALRRPRDQARYLLRLALLGAGNDPPDAGSTNDKTANTFQGGGGLVSTTLQSHP